MKGSQKVIDQLNFLLTGELTSMDLYFLHSRMYKDWGLGKLYERIDHEMDDEKHHASLLIERVIFLEGTPCLTKRDKFDIETSLEDMLKQSLKFEYEVAANLKAAIRVCEEEDDFVSRDMLKKLLVDTEEDHIDWLETQIDLIERIGIANYTQSQMGPITDHGGPAH